MDNPISDPFYLDAKIPFGYYKGQLINTTKNRAVTILDDTQYADDYPQQDNHWLVANIYHNKQFYIAQIPKDAVHSVLFTLEPFYGVLAHTMMRFKFAQPIYLIAKTPDKSQFLAGESGEILSQPIELKDILLTVEATSPKGVPEFAAIASLFYTRGIAFRMVSLTGRGINRYLTGKGNVKQYRLNLTQEQSNILFNTALLKSHHCGMSRMYQTMVSNCNWYTFDMLLVSKRFVEDDFTFFEKTKGYLRALLNRILIFSKVYPPLAIFGLTWRNFRQKDAPLIRNLEHDLQFKSMAKKYQEETGDLDY